jgi:hypothetical protein
VSNSYVSNIYKTLGHDVRSKIIQEYPDLNMDWLLTGRGEMLISDSEPILKEKPSYTPTDGLRDKHIEYLENIITYLEDKIAKLTKESKI